MTNYVPINNTILRDIVRCYIVSIGHASCTRELVWYLTKKHTVFRVIIKVTEKMILIGLTNI